MNAAPSRVRCPVCGFDVPGELLDKAREGPVRCVKPFCGVELLSKPFTMESLARKVAQVLQHAYCSEAPTTPTAGVFSSCISGQLGREFA